MGGDVYNGTVQLFDLDMELTDCDFEPLTGLVNCDLLLGHVLHLGQKLVDLSLELGLLLLSPGDNEIVSCK